VRHYPAVALTIPELCAGIALGWGVITLRPRLWIIDIQGARSRRWIPAICAAAAITAGPQLVLMAAASTALPPDAWAHSSISMLVMAGGCLIGTPYLGLLRTVTLSMIWYFATALTGQMVPAIRHWSPLALVTMPQTVPLPTAKLATVTLIVTAGFAVTAVTLGRTIRTWKHDEDQT
jgi:hypothetical protein